MRDLVMQEIVAFMEWASDSPLYNAIVCGVIVAGIMAFLWAMYDWVMPKFRVWIYRRRWYRM